MIKRRLKHNLAHLNLALGVVFGIFYITLVTFYLNLIYAVSTYLLLTFVSVMFGRIRDNMYYLQQKSIVVHNKTIDLHIQRRSRNDTIRKIDISVYANINPNNIDFVSKTFSNVAFSDTYIIDSELNRKPHYVEYSDFQNRFNEMAMDMFRDVAKENKEEHMVVYTLDRDLKMIITVRPYIDCGEKELDQYIEVRGTKLMLAKFYDMMMAIKQSKEEYSVARYDDIVKERIESSKKKRKSKRKKKYTKGHK